jgi:hypothetical protein
MDWSRHTFRSVWHLDARPDAVYRVLARPEEYPAWWPQVRQVCRTGETTGALRFRSVLPYDLFVTARATREDPGEGVLEVALRGDLEGLVRWTVRPGPPDSGGTRLLFEEDVVVNKPLMRALAAPCRPLFRANHALMMRQGRRGLGALLARV